MERENARVQHPALLSLGTCVGPWRVTAWAGRGVYGAVYQAVRVGEEHLAPVALKLALLPKDPRFAREAALLSRTLHPSIPRLIDAGDWHSPSGTLHPYVAMEWIAGTPLYDWASAHNPTSQQVLRLLAQLARALEALHAQGGVHRDVKGDNVMVRRSDGRAMLTDFGAGNYPEAATLTPQNMVPGTPAYRAPEVGLFPLRFGRGPVARCSAGPAQDLYALGVTGYRLVTGQYPALGEPRQDETGTWQLEEVAPSAPLEFNPRATPPLLVLMLRMLSVRPEARGTAGELAEALELAEAHPVQGSEVPLFPRQRRLASAGPGEAEQPAGVRGSAEAVSHPVRSKPRRTWAAMVAASVSLLAWAWWAAPSKPGEKPSVVQGEARGAGQKDGGAVGLGEAAMAASTEDTSTPSAVEVLADDTLPEPVPGQTRPNSQGRCPYRGHVPLNGGCWVETQLDREGCGASGYVMFKNKCYSPALRPKRQPHSSPAPQQ